jgi:hypothetical protein
MAAGELKAVASDELSPYWHFSKHLAYVYRLWPPGSLKPWLPASFILIGISISTWRMSAGHGRRRA